MIDTDCERNINNVYTSYTVGNVDMNSLHKEFYGIDYIDDFRNMPRGRTFETSHGVYVVTITALSKYFFL